MQISPFSFRSQAHGPQQNHCIRPRQVMPLFVYMPGCTEQFGGGYYSYAPAW